MELCGHGELEKSISLIYYNKCDNSEYENEKTRWNFGILTTIVPTRWKCNVISINALKARKQVVYDQLNISPLADERQTATKKQKMSIT